MWIDRELIDISWCYIQLECMDIITGIIMQWTELKFKMTKFHIHAFTITIHYRPTIYANIIHYLDT